MKPRPAPCRCERLPFPHRHGIACHEFARDIAAAEFLLGADESDAWADELATDDAARARDCNEAIR